MRNSITVLLLAVIMSGCQSMSMPFMDKPRSGKEEMVTEQKKVPPFNAIAVDGPIDVELVSQPPMERVHRITFSSSKDAAGTVDASVSNGTLYLHNMEKLRQRGVPRMHVVVPVGELRSIVFKGTGTLTGQNIRGENLTKVDVSSGTVNISGQSMGLRSVTATGGGRARISGINSPKVTVHGKDNTRISLAGKANSIEVVLSFNSILDAKYLRAENGFVNTADKSEANVNVTGSLNAFATGNSNIYYHQQLPQLLSKYLRHASSILFFND